MPPASAAFAIDARRILQRALLDGGSASRSTIGDMHGEVDSDRIVSSPRKIVQHYLHPLLMPKSVALVGASDRPGSLGRSVFENLRGGGFKGDIYAVNPRHRRVSGQRSYASVSAIGKPVDLVVITAPAGVIPGLLGAISTQVRAAVVMSTPDATDVTGARAWRRDVSAAAKKKNIRVVGPGAFGIIRTDIGLNATRMMTLTDPAPNWVHLAMGMGVDAASVGSCEQFSDILGSALKRRGPFLIECLI
jgi:predicted CoA-binding protein